MVLAETGGSRWLPIWIGRAEATALALSLEAAEMPRPLTYQLATDLVTASGATIDEVRITRLEPPVFYAAVVVASPAGTHEVDARPSDAVNLAVTAGAPIKVDSELFSLSPVQREIDLAACPVVTADIVAREKARLEEALATPGEDDA
jgi:bifunctional DNase/RNase